MTVQSQIKAYIASQPEPKRVDLQEMHRIVTRLARTCKSKSASQQWFLDGKNSEGKTVSNPNIGYGLQTLKKAAGEKSREFYQVGISANSTGISVYILGLSDKTYLAKKYGKKIGKASVTGYCIKFKALKDIHLEVLEAAISDGFKRGPSGVFASRAPKGSGGQT